jgi:hypothetical protein
MPARPHLGAKPIPYAGETRIKVTSVDDQPTFMVASSSFGQPRSEFVESVVLRLFGTQPDNRPHDWEIVEPAKAPEVLIPVDDPKVHDWLLDKVNGPNVGASR